MSNAGAVSPFPLADPDAFRPLPLDALFALALPTPEYAVGGILPLGALALLTGREKSGKGLLSIDLCASVALGEPFLGRAVREGPAIYCAAEENVRDVRERIAGRVGSERKAPFYVLPLDGSTGDRLRLNDAEGMNRLIAMIERLRPVVLVLDVLRELHDLAEDSSDEMGPLLRPLREIAHTTDTAIVLTHHQNKGGAFRGSTAIRAACDMEIAFSRPDGDDPTPKGTLRIEGRHGPRQLLHVEMLDGLRWIETSAPNLPAEIGLRAAILGAAAAHPGGLTAQEIADAIGRNLKSIQNELARMKHETPPPVVASGTGHRGAPRRYACGGMVPPDPTPLQEPLGGNQFPIVPDPSGSNGSALGNDGRGCVECGAPVASGRLYCPELGGLEGRTPGATAGPTPAPDSADACCLCPSPLPQGHSLLCATCGEGAS